MEAWHSEQWVLWKMKSKVDSQCAVLPSSENPELLVLASEWRWNPNIFQIHWICRRGIAVKSSKSWIFSISMPRPSLWAKKHTQKKSQEQTATLGDNKRYHKRATKYESPNMWETQFHQLKSDFFFFFSGTFYLQAAVKSSYYFLTIDWNSNGDICFGSNIMNVILLIKAPNRGWLPGWAKSQHLSF